MNNDTPPSPPASVPPDLVSVPPPPVSPSSPRPPVPRPVPALGPVGQLLSDPEKWEQNHDCSTDRNRATKPFAPHCIRWSVRAAIELKYGEEWRTKIKIFMECAHKYYPGMTYKDLHRSLSHEAMMFILRETKL